MGLVVFVGSALAKLNGSLNSSPYADWATSGRAQRLLALVPGLKLGTRLGELEEGLALRSVLTDIPGVRAFVGHHLTREDF